MEKTRIAIIDDEKIIRDTLTSALIKRNFDIKVFDNCLDALDALPFWKPSLIILDIMMPGMDGIEFCRQWRKLNTITSILFLSSCEGEEDKIEALLSGGDDYLTKPFSQKELLVRIEVSLRRKEWNSLSVSHNENGLILDKHSWRAWINGTEIKFTVSEFRILELFINHPDQVFSRDQINKAAFPEDNFISDRSTDAHIRRIRKKINKIDPQNNSIETVYGVGYRYSEK